ncbi:MAG: 5-amino-6-(D-ribitylamino)uracil--L-tyrosine 4-hydroxyphenyl transferase CofH [Solirubrobacterales bacterium]|nr:5-amino-6-(D-ribitylamino)uracil--L-tyrosine 4-hydroxyphenyl transferase CofH [Solirubrobacterales bacterium]
MAGRVTYSKNVTLSLSRSCASHCKYCAFATHKAHLQPPEEVGRILDRAARQGVKELLVLTGERPESIQGVQERLEALGHPDFVAYVVWACEQALERGILPHTNLGPLTAEDLGRLRRVTASQGLMLESSAARLLEAVHAGSPGKDPAVRLATMRAAGELRIPFTTGILVGIGETPAERLESLDAIAEVHAEYGHIQEVILQNFVPHRKYYGEEPADIAEAAADDYWRTGIGTHPTLDLPAWACEVTVEDMVGLVEATRERMPDVAIQIPPNLADWWPELVAAGADDLGGLSANGDHISPEHPFPSPTRVARDLAETGHALTERLCVHSGFINSDWVDADVLEVIHESHASFMPRTTRERLSSGPVRPRDEIAGIVSRAHAGDRLSDEDLTALFREVRPEAVEDIRQAADDLRSVMVGDTVTFVVNRNLNISNVCQVGCAFCGFGKGKRSPEAYEYGEDEFTARVKEALLFGATELCIQSGIHPDWGIEDYTRWLKLAKEISPTVHLHAYSPMEVDHICSVAGIEPDEAFARLKAAGLDSVPGTAAEVLDDDIRARISPNKLPAARWVEIIEASHRAGLPSTATVMFGHIETPESLARHMNVIRDLQERTGGITEFVPLSFVPDQTRLGRSHGITEMTMEDNLRHAAVYRLAIGRSIKSLQASWVKMGLEAAVESLDWGVNDLGGTLMEESITRMAGGKHGTGRSPTDLIAAAHKAGRPAAERTTLYGLREEYPLPLPEYAEWARQLAVAG